MTNKQLEVNSFQGWDGKVEELFQPRQSSYLFGLGLEGFVRYLKVWNTDKADKAGSPELVRCSRLGRPGSQSEPVCIALSESLTLLAVGYDDGGWSNRRPGPSWTPSGPAEAWSLLPSTTAVRLTS